MNQVLNTRTYRKGDEDGIYELWKAVHPDRQYDRGKWMRWWNWMFIDNPVGKGRIWLAEHNEKIVGQYAMVPIRIKVGDEVVTGSLSLQTMTHPDYRRQNIFETLAVKAYEEAEKDDIFFVFGFPNKFSYPGFVKKLQWFDIAYRQLMVKPYDWGTVISSQIKNKYLATFLAFGASCTAPIFNMVMGINRKTVPKDLDIVQISSFDEHIDVFWNEISKRYKIMVVRDSRYLNWRYVDVPNAEYVIFLAKRSGEIEGYTILRCRPWDALEVGCIFDIMAYSPETAQGLLYKTIEYFKQQKPDFVFCDMIADKSYSNLFRMNGFLSVSRLKKKAFCAYLTSPRITMEFIADAENWYSQQGDSDWV